MDPCVKRAIKLLAVAAILWLAIMSLWYKHQLRTSAPLLTNEGLTGECFPEDLQKEEQAEIERLAAAQQAEIDLYYYKAVTKGRSYHTRGGCHVVEVDLHSGPEKGSSLIARVQSPGVIPAGTTIELTVIPSDASEEDVGDCAGQWFVIPPGNDEMVRSDKP